MKPHGYLDLKWSGDILFVEAFGPFNDEGAKEAADAYVDLILNRKSPTFSVIEILHDDSMGTPDTMTEVAKIWNFIRDNGCTALALIYANEVQRALAEQYIPEFGRLFSSLEEAEKWIQERRG